jgi:hypothetical protein
MQLWRYHAALFLLVGPLLALILLSFISIDITVHSIVLGRVLLVLCCGFALRSLAGLQDENFPCCTRGAAFLAQQILILPGLANHVLSQNYSSITSSIDKRKEINP